jgi:hypothetical protein
MKTNKLFVSDLSLVCGKDPFRPVYSYVVFCNGFAWATNAHILIKQDLHQLMGMDPEIVMLLEDKAIHMTQFKEMLKGVEFEVFPDHIKTTMKNGTILHVPLHTEESIGAKFPKYQNVIPQNTQEISEIGLNYKLLADLSKAMVLREPDNGVHLRFHGPAMGVLVKSMGIPTEHQLGLIMPVMLNSSKF